jgi:transcriptional regulator with XRE-family HTH domain
VTVEDSVLTDTTIVSGGARVAGGSAHETHEAITAAVAQHVRALRLARGWSLDELAGRSGVSKGMVVQIENARTNPSVGTLCRIADAYGVTVARLLEPGADRRVHIRSAVDAATLWHGEHGGMGRLLAGVNDPDFAELWEWVLHPGDRHASPDHAPGTRELLHVLTGELTVVADGSTHTIQTGQTMDFVADKPHEYRNDGAEPTRMVMIVLMPSGGWDRRDLGRGGAERQE